MTLETAFVFAISIILLYIKPGPNQAMKITRGLNDGFFPAWYFTMGATSTVIFYFVVAAVSATMVQTFMQSAGFYFKLIGGAYLLYLGYRGLNNIEKGVWKGRLDHSHKRDFIENYSLGLIMTLANPITIFFFIGIVPTIMPLGTLHLTDILLGVFIIAFFGNLADMILIAMVTEVKKSLSNTIFVRKINMFASIGFVMIGAFFFYSAFFFESYAYTL